jgi:hypothetical protein
MCSGTLSVKANDEIGRYFKSKRWVRQGDPLSSLLFNLVVDYLAKMVQKTKQN